MILIEEVAVIGSRIIDDAKVIGSEMTKASTGNTPNQGTDKPSLDRVDLRPEEETLRLRDFLPSIIIR